MMQAIFYACEWKALLLDALERALHADSPPTISVIFSFFCD
jgi:hypothetical protein